MFFAAFRETGPRTDAARAVFDGILLSDITSDNKRILEIPMRHAPVLVRSVHGLPGAGKSFLVDKLALRRGAVPPITKREVDAW